MFGRKAERIRRLTEDRDSWKEAASYYKRECDYLGGKTSEMALEIIQLRQRPGTIIPMHTQGRRP